MLTILDFLYITIAIAIIITTIFVNMILYNTYKALKAIRRSSERALLLTSKILSAKQQAKLAILKPVQAMLKRIRKLI